MVIAPLPPIYDDLLDFLARSITPEEMLAYRPSDLAQQRAEELLEKNSAGILTSAENAELQQMLQVDRMVSVLKARALESLSQS